MHSVEMSRKFLNTFSFCNHFTADRRTSPDQRAQSERPWSGLGAEPRGHDRPPSEGPGYHNPAWQTNLVAAHTMGRRWRSGVREETEAHEAPTEGDGGGGNRNMKTLEAERTDGLDYRLRVEGGDGREPRTPLGL